MRLSDAIAIGRTLCIAKEGGYNSREPEAGVGCALDMAVLAVDGKNWCAADRYWPWLLGNGSDDDRFLYVRSYRAQIIDMFDKDVMVLKTKTLDQLIDWIRSVEPQEPEDEPCAATVETPSTATTKA